MEKYYLPVLELFNIYHFLERAGDEVFHIERESVYKDVREKGARFYGVKLTALDKDRITVLVWYWWSDEKYSPVFRMPETLRNDIDSANKKLSEGELRNR
jgi:hypothetical protein